MQTNHSPERKTSHSTANMQLKWSPRLKHSDAEINRKILSRTNNRLSRFGFSSVCGLMETISEATHSGKYEWAVRINSLRNYMYIGICQIRQASKHMFENWGWRYVGHGHYCITSYGFAYSHSDASMNFKRKSF